MRFTVLNPRLLLLLPLVSSSAIPESTYKTLQWGNCTAHDPPNLSCAQLSVPIDWNQPDGGNITITTARLAAVEKKTGTMFFNPGGPGASTVGLFFDIAESANGNKTLFPPQFDIIGPDPRGIGSSHPMKCDPGLWNKNANFQPSSEEEFQQLVQGNRELGESCRKLTGPAFDHFDSRSIARDFDAIRAALGEEKMTYLGISYGTVIGQAYAELFPRNIRAIALDGNVDHALPGDPIIALTTFSFNNVFEIFADWCATTPNNALYGKNVTKLWTELASHAPLPAPSCEKSRECQSSVTLFDFISNFHDALAFKDPTATGEPTWYNASESLKEASMGDASALSNLLAKNSSSPPIYEAGYQTLCLDWNPVARDFSGFESSMMMSSDIAPLMYGIAGLGPVSPRCIGWPAPVQYCPKMDLITGVPPLLLTNAYHDPETPYTEAVGLAARINGSVLATRNGDGHTSYFLLGETYAAINKYLVTLETPGPNTVFST